MIQPCSLGFSFQRPGFMANRSLAVRMALPVRGKFSPASTVPTATYMPESKPVRTPYRLPAMRNDTVGHPFGRGHHYGPQRSRRPAQIAQAAQAVPTPVAPAAGDLLVAPVVNWGQMSGYYGDGLGFSLKPPKWIRKAASAVKSAITIKNVAKVAAVAVGVALIPGALPLLAKGAVGASKLVVGGGRLIGKGVVGIEHMAAKNISTAGGILTGKATRTGVPGTPGAQPADVFNADGSPASGPGSESNPINLPGTVTSPTATTDGSGGGITIPGITVNANRTGVPGTPGAPSTDPISTQGTYTNPTSTGGGAGALSPSGQVPETAGASTDANPNLVPLLIGGAALLLLAPTLMHKRR